MMFRTLLCRITVFTPFYCVFLLGRSESRAQDKDVEQFPAEAGVRVRVPLSLQGRQTHVRTAHGPWNVPRSVQGKRTYYAVLFLFCLRFIYTKRKRTGRRLFSFYLNVNINLDSQ